MTFLALGVTAFYLFLGWLLRQALTSVQLDERDWRPRVSVVVAARNEAPHLPRCLDSLMHLDYPQDKLDIVVVDDDSTDDSARIIRFYAEQSTNVKSIELKASDKVKPGKAGALLVGIGACAGEIIFVTDADCYVPPSWITSMLSLFDEHTGLVGGFTLIDGKNSSWLVRLQRLDWLFLLAVASAASRMGKPISWVGNNLAFRREVYEAVGGYLQLEDSYVEDFALINAINRKTVWRCVFYAHPDNRVFTHPAESLAHLYQQRKRWATGISHARPFGWLIMSTGFVAHVVVLTVLFTAPAAALMCLVLMGTIDALLLHRASALLDSPVRKRDILGFKLYYVLYTILLPLLLLLDRRIVWKPETPRHSHV